MAEEAAKEAAATNEPPGRLASPEFFFLLQRVDRLDEKASARMDGLDQKLSTRIEALDQKVSLLDQKLSARMEALDERLTKKIEDLDERLTRKIEDLGLKFGGEVKRLESRLDGLKSWTITLLITVIVGFGGTIAALLRR